ncbi:hypothetical protein AV654_17860 [Paenibacillus elgii]|uniref:Uncharacterized protein n=1 Tax=Paenibacillus elgii TaxID=189691 RepID=A0A161SEN2_9BACL|nr:hypothetical protein [Paenibacillus elgii]KZE79335.1 hypothetical protein AV654_17860 [Paenibacillus elgii]
MNDLKARVEAMVNGESKRREVALKFLKELEEILLPVAPILWKPDGCDAVHVSGDVYFCWSEYSYGNHYESTGFHVTDTRYEILRWGTELADIEGTEFWEAMRSILRWVERLGTMMDDEDAARNDLLSLIARQE